MTVEASQPSPEYLARAAISEYLDVGPEPNFGDIKVSTLDTWIGKSEAALRSLSPAETANVAWMRIERCWSRITEAGLLGQPAPPDIAALIKTDVRLAKETFHTAQQSADAYSQAEFYKAAYNTPIVELILTHPENSVKEKTMAGHLHAQITGTHNVLEQFKFNRKIHQIPQIDSWLGMRLLGSNFLNTPWLPVVAAPRHWQRGSPYARWHALLYNREHAKSYKVRIAPAGPPDMILLPPSLFEHASLPTKHLRGMMEAMAYMDAWNIVRRDRERVGQKPPITPYLKQYSTAIVALDERVEAHLDKEIERVSQPPPEYAPPADCVQWYETLSPFADPCHEQHGGALDIAISQLELARSNGENTSESDFLLGHMYLESGMSVSALSSSNRGVIIGSFERAEDIFSDARNALPESQRSGSRYFQLAIAEVSAAMYRALIAGENTDEQLDIYCSQLALISQQMLEAYQQLTDKNCIEGQALDHLLHQITAILLVSHSNMRAYVALPGPPRNRGGLNGHPRGWDFTMWTLDAEDSYKLGQFYGRIDANDDPYSIDNGVVTIPKKKIGHGEFRVLKALLATINPPPQPEKIDYKSIHKANELLIEMVVED